jgi:chromosome segregation ATPase
LHCGGQNGSVTVAASGVSLYFAGKTLVEQIVDFTLGFVICGLIGLAFLPMVSGRARRLTLARIESRLPMTFDEIEAERDLLRARHAVEVRALEVKAEQERTAHAQDEAELGRRALAIRQAQEALSATAALLKETEEKLAQALDYGEKTTAALNEARETLAARDQSLEQKASDYAALEEARRLLELRAQGLEADLAEAEGRLAAFDARRKRLLARIVTERRRGDGFEQETLELRRALAEAGAAAGAPVMAINSDGVAFPLSPEREMLDLREAIARIGQQVAHLDAAGER